MLCRGLSPPEGLQTPNQVSIHRAAILRRLECPSFRGGFWCPTRRTRQRVPRAPVWFCFRRRTRARGLAFRGRRRRRLAQLRREKTLDTGGRQQCAQTYPTEKKGRLREQRNRSYTSGPRSGVGVVRGHFSKRPIQNVPKQRIKPKYSEVFVR